MRTSSITSLIATVTLLPAIGAASTMLTATFESPSFILGDINGQNGWSTFPTNVVGFVQSDVALSGKQAIALGGTGRIAMAQMPTNVSSSGMFMASVGIFYQPKPVGTSLVSPAAGLSRIVARDLHGNTVVFEYGFRQASSPRASAGAPPNQFSAFANVIVDGKTVGSTMAPMPDKTFSGWHRYGLQLNSTLRTATLFVDGKPVRKVQAPFAINAIETVGLQATMPGTLPDKTLMYFDDVTLVAP